ncbi:MAG: Ribonuclease [Bacteroidota bacterium]
MNFTFPKSERLHQKKVIEILFQKDNPIVSQQFVYPFRVLYLSQEKEYSAPQILISISKRRFKKAVDRNTLKRRTREAYRLQKPFFHQINGKTLPQYLAFIYIGKTIESFQKIERKMTQILQQLSESNETNAENN